jgi:hypothetical protein
MSVGPDDQHRPSKVVQLVVHERLARGVFSLDILKGYVVSPACMTLHELNDRTVTFVCYLHYLLLVIFII